MFDLLIYDEFGSRNKRMTAQILCRIASIFVIFCMEVLRHEFGLLVGTGNLDHNVQNSCHIFSLNLGRCFEYKYIYPTILHLLYVKDL